MKIVAKIFFVLMICSQVKAQVQMPAPAQTVPAFELYKFDKTLFTNKNLAVNKPLFFFFFDCTCEHCQHAMTYLNQHFSDFKKAGVYLISLDQQQTINVFLRKYAPNVIGQKNVTILQDSKNEFIIRFKPRKYPSLFLYDSNKKLLFYDDNPESMTKFSKLLNNNTKK